jgi:CBS domain-containing protein
LACAQDIMTKDLITIKETTPVREAIQIILQKKISGLPVVSDDMLLIGIVTEKDLLGLSFYDNVENSTAADVMTREIISMPQETDLLDVCDFFMNNNYKRLPIVCNKKLIGIISRKDILKYILKNKM